VSHRPLGTVSLLRKKTYSPDDTANPTLQPRAKFRLRATRWYRTRGSLMNAATSLAPTSALDPLSRTTISTSSVGVVRSAALTDEMVIRNSSNVGMTIDVRPGTRVGAAARFVQPRR
jgi:hypothetical protein